MDSELSLDNQSSSSSSLSPPSPSAQQISSTKSPFAVGWRALLLLLVLPILVIVIGNLIVFLGVLTNRKLLRVTTNRFIASLAISDLLVGVIVMPLSLYSTVNELNWELGERLCQLHLVTGVFSTTASIVHLTAISFDRYFAIIFPTEYQRHSLSTSTLPYILIIWLMSFAVSSTLFMEKTLDSSGMCWISNPQYLVLSSLLSFFVPGIIVVYLYVKIFFKLRRHRQYVFGQSRNSSKHNPHASQKSAQHALPRVIIEEVMSRRESRLSQTAINLNIPRHPSTVNLLKQMSRSPSQPNVHSTKWRSPTICAETLEHDRLTASKQRMSIVPDPPSMDVISQISSLYNIKAEQLSETDDASKDLNSLHLSSNSAERLPLRGIDPIHIIDENVSIETTATRISNDATVRDMKMYTLTVPNAPNQIDTNNHKVVNRTKSLQVPVRETYALNCSVASSNSSKSSCTTATGSDDLYRRTSMNSFGSSVTDDATDSGTVGTDSRKLSAIASLRSAMFSHNFTSVAIAKGLGIDTNKQKKSNISRGKLRKIATEVTRAIRRRRRESMAIKRESRATRVVAAILMAFLICWIPYFCVSVYRGVCTGLRVRIDQQLHMILFMVTTWLGYAHSCFNPIIYTCLNKSFRRSMIGNCQLAKCCSRFWQQQQTGK